MDTTKKASKTISPKKSTRSKSDGTFGMSSEMSRTSCESTLTQVSQIEISKFCPKKLFYIFLVNENGDKSASLLDDLINVNKDYEEISCVTFISREDVLSLARANKDCIFPSHLKPLLLNVIENVNNSATDLSLNEESQLLKLKLIQVMYSQYVNKVKTNDKERTLETLLNALSKECKKKQKREENSPKDEEKSKYQVKEENRQKTKKDNSASNGGNKDEVIDYTNIPLNKDGISFEENILDYVWFYCLTGFYNADIIQNLIEQISFPVSGVIKITHNSSDQSISELNRSGPVETFWQQIKQYFFGNTSAYKSMENTILLQFAASELKSSLVGLEDFVLVLREFLNVKLAHLQYLRYLKIHKIQHSYAVKPMECLQIYDKHLRNIPSECINPQLVLNGLLKEVCYTMESHTTSDTPSLRSLFLAKSCDKSKSLHCVDFLHDVDAIAPQLKSEIPITVISVNKDVPSFLVHENDILMKILKSYKYIGPQIASTTLNLMKCIPILSGLDYSKSILDIAHSHDVDPSRNQTPETDQVDDLMYIFLFSNVARSVYIPEVRKEYELVYNLCTFDLCEYWNEVQPKFDEASSVYFDQNIYDTSIVHFYWKENLSKELLIQEVFDASNEFLYADKNYSPESDNLLTVFSDKLDEFGINIKIINAVVRTPICFRDFCRYTVVDEAAWLQTNEVNISESTFKTSFDESCPGAQKVKMQYKVFQEYFYLLNGNINENDSYDLSNCTSEQHQDIKQTPEISFPNILNDLERCSPNVNPIQETENSIKAQQSIAYNLGSSVFKVVGNVTTFHSHDNVKVTIDNTRFLQTPEKCTFTVYSEGNVLILHTGKSLVTKPYIVTLGLNDKTRLSFFIREERQIEHVPEIDRTNVNPGNREDENEIANVIYDNDTANMPIIVDDTSNIDDGAMITNAAQLVHYVDADFINTLLEGKSLDDLAASEDTDDLLESIIKARENNGIIYKVNTPSNYLKRRKSDIKAPLRNALRNIASVEEFAQKQQKAYKVFTKRFGSNQVKKSDLDVNYSMDFRICLPNGLYIRPHSSVIDKSIIMIKQEYTAEKPNVLLIQHEEFRLFSNQGLVLIKAVDGTIRILKANGDMFSFEKPSDGCGDNSTINPCHCSTFDDYRNKLNKLLKESSDYSSSRRGHITSKQNHILDKKILKVLEEFNVPFLKKSITKFDGKKIKIQGDKITQKQLYHLTSQHDFFTGEIFFERNDDFRGMFYKNGSQTIMFPDGTIISNSIDVSDELVDDFVYVTLNYEYEHPYYVKVKFNFDNTSEITLNDDVVIKESFDKNGFQVDLNHGLCLSISNENVNVQKACAACTGKIDINFNVKPFRDGCWNADAEFMRVKDSYNKELRSDFLGSCSRNSDYIRSALNAMKCNHAKTVQYKKLFVINKDLTGEMLMPNDFVRSKISKMKKLPNVSVDTYNPISNENKTIVDCREKFFVKYSERFHNNITGKIPSGSDKDSSHEIHFYSTFRTFQKMFESVDEIASHVSKMWHVFFNEFFDKSGDKSIYKTITHLGNALEAYFRKYQDEVLTEENELCERNEKQTEDLDKKGKENAQCNCVKERLTMEEKIHNWKQHCIKHRTEIRKHLIPIYFKSQFCKMST